MVLARLAVGTVFVCVGVLLLSACGLPDLLPARRRDVPLDTFLLRDHAAPGHVVGFGALSGDTAFLSGNLTVLEPACLAGERISMSGSIADGQTAHLRLFPDRNDGPTRFLLTADLPHVGRGYSYRVLPFTGNLQVTSSCGGNSSRAVDVVVMPFLYGAWAGIAFASPQPPITVDLMLVQEPLDKRAHVALSGSIALEHSPCATGGVVQPAQDMGSETGPFALTFQMTNGSQLKMTLPVNFFELNKPVLDATFTYAGGPCNRQTFHARLINH